MKYKFIDAFESGPIEILKNPTPEQEADILAQYISRSLISKR